MSRRSLNTIWYRLLSLKGIHYIARRLPFSKICRAAFDSKFATGSWSFLGSADPYLGETVKQYCSKGNLLILGCGEAAVLASLDLSQVGAVVGVDLSMVALKKARARFPHSNVNFILGDMRRLLLKFDFDIVMFPESINYLSRREAIECLLQYRRLLRPQGVIVLTFSNPERYRKMIVSLTRQVEVVERRRFEGSKREFLILR